jgi:hypothetical protein
VPDASGDPLLLKSAHVPADNLVQRYYAYESLLDLEVGLKEWRNNFAFLIVLSATQEHHLSLLIPALVVKFEGITLLPFLYGRLIS